MQLCAKVQQRSTLVFLQAYPTPQAALAASVEEIPATLRTGKQTNPTQVAAKIVEELHRPQLVASEVIVRAKSRLMLSLVKQLLVVIEESASDDEAIRPFFCASLTRSCGGRCRVPASDPHVCWPNGAMIAATLPMKTSSRPWPEPRPCRLKAAITPKRTNAAPA